MVSSETVAGDGNGAPLFYRVENSTIITQAHTSSCDVNGAPCEDGNACTINEVCTKVVKYACAMMEISAPRLLRSGNRLLTKPWKTTALSRPGGVHGGWILCERRMRRRDPSGLHRPMSIPRVWGFAYVQPYMKSTLRDSPFCP